MSEEYLRGLCLRIFNCIEANDGKVDRELRGELAAIDAEFDRSSWQGLPIKEMIKRGWLPGINDYRDSGVPEAICRFFGVKYEDELVALLASYVNRTPNLGQ